MFRRHSISKSWPALYGPHRRVSRRLLRLEQLEDRCLLAAMPTLLSLSAAPTALVGQPLQFTAVVTAPGSPAAAPSGGTVTFMDGNVCLGTAPLIDGQASLVNSLFAAGTHTVTALYNGDGSTWAGSASLGNALVVSSASGGAATSFALPCYASASSGFISPLNTAAPTGMTPTEIRQAYGTSSITFGSQAANGAGTTIAIVDAYDDPNIASDLTAFDTAFGLPAPPSFSKVNETGGTTPPVANSGWITEIALDVEWSHAVAPGANILLVEANSNSDSDLYTAVNYARSAAGVVAVSMSWGGGESSSDLSTDSDFTTPSGHAGVTFLASSGDSGSPAGYPAYSPNVVAVGGTSLYLTAQGTYSSEAGWSGSGGGISQYEAQPSYQKGVVTQSTTMRTAPDISYDADPNTGFPVYDSYNNGTTTPWGQWGGTSDAAPQWAALVAIADQGRALAGLSSLDGPTQTLPLLYAAQSGDFHDITSGGSTGSPPYSCGPGYDLVTGRGTPQANLLIPLLAGATMTSTTLTASASTVTYGQSVTLTATVTAASGTAAPTGGTVTFLDYGTAIGTATLASGTATFTSTTLNYGVHQLTASYGGSGTTFWPSATASAGLTSASIITTVAGDGLGDGSPAAAATLNNPSGDALDAAGDLFIADTSNNRVREVNHLTGVITTVAGTGISGYSGDGGAATAAELNSPNAVALDSSGNLYIADGNNQRIREVNLSTGVITTVAGSGSYGFAGDGGQATAAALEYPEGLTLDSSGNLYIADYYNDRIREVNHATGVITTVAGNGTAGYNSDGIQATAAELDDPASVAADSSGNLYIADYYNQRIRKVNLSTGVITTVAGTGTSGYGGDGGLATAAKLDDPRGVAVDSSGNIYIADYYNERIREVNVATGNISTLAGSGSYGFSGDGSQATAAAMEYPKGVAVDSAGDLYIVDSNNNRIRFVNRSTGVITTFAGGYTGDGAAATAAALDVPDGDAVDAAGDIFIADTSDNRIREVNHATGLITTVAGTGVSGYNGDNGQATAAMLAGPHSVAVDAAGNVYIADTNNNRVREVNHATGVITTVAGNGSAGYNGDNIQATAAELYDPEGVVLDGKGDLFISDFGNNRVREVNLTTGVITTVAGGNVGDCQTATAASLDEPQSVAVDSAGDVFIADTYDNRVREVNHATGLISTVAGNGGRGYNADNIQATAAELDDPYAIALDSAGNLYIADTYNSRIRKVNLATGVITTVAGTGNLGYNGDGGAATAAWLDDPEGVALDGKGDLFIADYNNNRVRKVNLSTGVITTIAGNGTSGYSGDGGLATAAEISHPWGIAADSAGDVFFADYSNNRIREVNAAGVIFTVAGNGTAGYSGDGGAATAAGLDYPSGVAVDSSGDIFIADNDDYRVREVNAATGVITTVAGSGAYGFGGDGGAATAAKLEYARGVALDSSGNLYIADFFNDRIREVNLASGTISTVAGNGSMTYVGDGGPATAAGLDEPEGLTVDAAGNLYIADTYDQRIRKITLATGVITTVAGNGSSGYLGDGGAATAANLNDPEDVAVDAAGNLYIADWINNRIRVVNASTGVIGTLAGISSVGGGTQSEGFSGDGGPASASVLNEPTDVALDSAGDLYITDSNNDRVREIAAGGLTLTVDPAASSSTTLVFTAPSTTSYGSTVALSATLLCGGIAVSGETISFTVHGAAVATAVTNATGVALASAASVAGFVPGTYANFLGGVFSGSSFWTTSSAAANLTITPAPLTIAANSTAKVYGAPDPAFSATYAGFVSGEGLANLGGTLAFSTNEPASGFAPGGSYTITPSGLTSSNYAITFVPGVLTVNPAATSTVLGVSTTSIVYGQSVTLTATLTVAAPSAAVATGGTVTFLAGGTNVGSATLSAGTATLATTAIPAGTQGLVAVYNGNANFAASRSGTLVGATISTVAGDGTAGYGGDGSQATAAMLNWPYSVAVDASGDIFIADNSNMRVREVNGATGVITTVAGDGTAGFSGDGGQATAAELTNPCGLLVDSTGHLFIADAGNNRVREVNLATGIITTIAGGGSTLGDGGPATLAMLDVPISVAEDGSGHLFIADLGNSRIRELDLPTGVIATFAGNGTAGYAGDGGPATAAEFNAPLGIALDGSGDLFIADAANSRVREVNASTDVVTTVAGTGAAGYSGDGGPATAAELGEARYVAVDSAGNLFIGDYNNARVREVYSATGTIATIAGNGTAGYAGDGGLATAAELDGPGGLALDGDGRLYIADSYNDRVRVLTPAATAAISVTPAPLTVTANSLTKVYGALLPTLTASYLGLVNGDTAASLSTAPNLTTTATAASPVGGYSIGVSGAVDPNYAISYVSGTLNVTPAPLTITAVAGDKVYGTADPAFAASYLGFIPGEGPANLGGALAYSTNEPAGNAPVGSYTVTPLGLASTNYAITYVAGTLSVIPTPLIVMANVATKTYGSADPAFSVTCAGFASGDGIGNLGGTLSFTTNEPASGNAPAGSYRITPSGLTSANYSIWFAPGVLLVNPAPLVVTANNQSTTYGTALPALTASYSGFVGGDSAASLSTRPTLNTQATAASPAGSYVITPSGAVDPNYSISYVDGSLTVYAEVAGQDIFYANSSYSAASSSSADAAAASNAVSNAAGGDANAIDTSKTALLPGQTATYANYTDSAQGLNGLIVDVGGLANPSGLTAADFQFLVGNDNNLSDWQTLATAPTITVLAGSGNGGTDRIQLTWPDDTIHNQWLQVTVRADANTGLAAPDVFYFGSEPGAVQGAGYASFDDIFAVYRAIGNTPTVTAATAADVNHDGMITFDDIFAVYRAIGGSQLNMITAPAAPATSPATAPAADATISTVAAGAAADTVTPAATPVADSATAAAVITAAPVASAAATPTAAPTPTPVAATHTASAAPAIVVPSTAAAATITVIEPPVATITVVQPALAGPPALAAVAPVAAPVVTAPTPPSADTPAAAMAASAVAIRPPADVASNPPQAVIVPVPMETAVRSATGEISVGLARPDAAPTSAALPAASPPSALASSTVSSAGTSIVPAPPFTASVTRRPLPLPWTAQPFLPFDLALAQTQHWSWTESAPDTWNDGGL